jgi:chemotaxis protein CheD
MTLTSTSPSLLVAGIGEMVLSSDADARLVAYGLGSCIALAVWDPRTRASGLAHFMLPSGPANSGSPVKFIDTGLDTFLKAMEAKGAVLSRSVCKAAGAAAMLTVGGGLAIGKRNAESMQGALTERGLKLAATALGGNAGRTVQLEVADGRFLVKSLSSVTEL